MAYYLKVLEKGTDDTIDGGTVLPVNLYGLESTGYTAANCALTYSATNHTNSITGNAASTAMSLHKNNSIAATNGHLVYMRADITVSSSGLSSISLALAGSGGGEVYGSGTGAKSNPVNGTTYSLYVRVTVSGLTGNYMPKVYAGDPTSINGKTIVIKNWCAIDLTTHQGAGNESSAADIEAWIQWRMTGMAYLDWYEYATGTEQFYRWERVNAHGLSTYDVRYRNNKLISWEIMDVISPIIRIDSNWYATNHYIPGSYSVAGDPISVYKQTDRTSRVLANTLNINLRSDIEASVTCEMYGDATWQPLVGMTVLIYDGTTLLHTGKIREITRSRYDGAAAWKCSVTIGTMSETVGRAPTDYGTDVDGLTARQVVLKLRGLTINNGAGLGIFAGRIDTGVADVGEFDVTNRNCTEMLNDLAKMSGYIWYIDSMRKLHFRTPFTTPADAAHALVDGNGYTDYRNVEYTQSTEQYRTTQAVRGDYADDGTPIYARRTLEDLTITPPISIDTEASGNGYIALMDNNELTVLTDAQDAADAQLKMYGAQVPCSISFESGSTDWRPNTKLTVQLAALGISSAIYFNIDSVELFDANGTTIRSRVTASQRDPTNFAVAPNSGPSEFLGMLQQAAQNSTGALKQEAGTFTPELRGSGTAGTFTYADATKQIGGYIRFGNMVYVNIRLVPASISGSPTGGLQVIGLPYAAKSDLAQFLDVFCQGVNWGTSMTGIKYTLANADTYGTLYGIVNNGAWAAVPVGNVAVNDDIRIQGWYQITP